MRLPRIRFPARWVVTAAILASVLAVLVAIERNERRRNAIVVARAEIAYRNAKHARDRAERAVTEYAERTFPRELATVEAEIKRDEDTLNCRWSRLLSAIPRFTCEPDVGPLEARLG
jgi:hypothetical protein